MPKNSADSGQITKVQPPFFGLFCSLAVNDFFSGAMTRSVYRDLRALGGRAEFGEPRCEGVRQGVEAARGSGVFALRCDGLAGIATDADARIDFDFAEDGHAVSDRGFRAFAVAEDVDGLVAVRADEGAHVFDDAEDFDVDLAEHFDGFANVGEGDGRWSGDNDGAGDRDGLDQGELDVAGARRKIDQEIVELAPDDAAQELRDDAVQHRAAPNHRCVAGAEQAHRDHLDALRFDRMNALVGRGPRFFLRAEHDGDVRAVDVSVEQADLVAEFRESERKIDGDCGFADAAFAAGDGDEIFYAGDWLARGELLGLGCWRHFVVRPF